MKTTPTPVDHETRAVSFTRTSTVAAVLLLVLAVLSALLPGCSARPAATAEQRAERMAPDPVGLHPATVETYTTADRFEAPLRPADATPAP